jgi:hypothetical protein
MSKRLAPCAHAAGIKKAAARVFARGGLEYGGGGESNPRPETSAVPASTCLVGVLISIRAAIADILRAAPAGYDGVQRLCKRRIRIMLTSGAQNNAIVKVSRVGRVADLE